MKPKSRRKADQKKAKTVLRLPDLEFANAAVLDGLTSTDAQRGYLHQREDHWAIVDLRGKDGHVRTVPIPYWVIVGLNEWVRAAENNRGRIFRKVTKMSRIWGDSMTDKAVWNVVKECARTIGVAKLAPHDLRRTRAKLCQASGRDLEQIQLLPGHVSVQTTERSLGYKQRIRSAVNDRIGIESDS